MQNSTLKQRISASFKGALLPFLPTHGTGPGDNFITLANLFGKQDPTPIKKPQDAYDRYLGWIRAAVSLIAFDVRSNPFTIWDRNGKTDREDWKAIEPKDWPGVMKRPNLKLTIQDLIEINQMSMDLTGEGFFHLVCDTPGGTVNGIQFLYTEWVQRYNTNETQTEITGWDIMNPVASLTRTIADIDIVQFKYPNPEDPVRGSSPLSAVATSQDLDTYLRNHVSGFFKGGGLPSVAIKTNLDKISGEQRDAVVETFKDRFNQTTDPGVLSKGADIIKIGYPLKDLDLAELTKFSREQILAIYGIPPAKFGIKEAGGMSEDTKGYEYSYQKICLRPRLLRQQEEINISIVPRIWPDRDVFWEFDNPVQEDVKAKQDMALGKLTAGTVTVNEFRGEMGEPATDDGNVYYVPNDVTRVPDGELNIIPEVQQLSLRLTESEQKSLQLTQMTGTYRMQLAQLEFLRSQDAQERTLKSRVRGQLSREQKMVLSAFDKTGTKEGPDETPEPLETELKFVGPHFKDNKLVNGAMVKAYKFTGGIIEQTNLNAWSEVEVQAVKTGLASGISLVATEIGEEATLSTSELAIEANELAGERVGLITNTSYQDVNAVVDSALKAGKSTEEIRQAILQKYDNWKGYRAEAIARTETANAVNTGKQWGAENIATEYDLDLEKQWVSTLDFDTRDSHRSANKQKRDLKKPFNVGGASLMNPGEYGGPPEETINCRCTVVFSVLD